MLTRPFRIILCVLAAAALAAAIRDDRGSEGSPWAADLADVPQSEGARAVLDALEAAGTSGLAAGFEMLDAPSAHVRVGAAAYLGRRRSRRAVPHLIRRLHDPDPLVRLAAARSLGAIGDRRALPFLERTVGGDRVDVAEAALLAARRIRAIHDDD